VARLRISYAIPLTVLAAALGLSAVPASAAASGTWTTTGSLNTAREDQTATVLANGQVLITGGVHFVKHTFTELAGAELYTP
jgi:hypothetical protein